MWSRTKIQLTENQRKQVEDFYKKSDRYVRLLCFHFKILPKITQDDIYGKVYERLCVYVQHNNLVSAGYQKLAYYLVMTSRNSLVDSYHKHTLLIDDRIDDDDTNSFIDDACDELPINDYEKNIENDDIENKKNIIFSCLTSSERKIMEEIYRGELNQSEIAEKYGCTKQYISFLISSARKKLQKMILQKKED